MNDIQIALNLLEIVLAHGLVTAVAMQTFDATIRKGLTRIPIFRAALADKPHQHRV